MADLPVLKCKQTQAKNVLCKLLLEVPFILELRDLFLQSKCSISDRKLFEQFIWDKCSALRASISLYDALIEEVEAVYTIATNKDGWAEFQSTWISEIDGLCREADQSELLLNSVLSKIRYFDTTNLVETDNLILRDLLYSFEAKLLLKRLTALTLAKIASLFCTIATMNSTMKMQCCY